MLNRVSVRNEKGQSWNEYYIKNRLIYKSRVKNPKYVDMSSDEKVVSNPEYDLKVTLNEYE